MLRLKLRYLLAAAFVLVSLVPVLFLGIWVQRTAFQREVAAVEEKHLLLAQNITAALERYAADTTAAFRHFISVGDVPDARGNVEGLAFQMGFRHFCVIDAEGQVVRRLDAAAANEKQLNPVIIERLWAMAEDSPAFSPVMANAQGDPTIFLVQRLGPDQVAIGVLSTDYMVKLQKAIAFGRRGHAAIVDQEGNTLAHPSAEWQREMKNIAKIDAVRRMVAGERGVSRFYSPVMKGDMIAGFATVAGPGWGVMVPQPLEELEERAAEVQAIALAVALFGLTVAALVGWLLAGRLARPVAEVVRAANDMAEGRLDARVPPQSGLAPEELRELPTAFNAMAKIAAPCVLFKSEAIVHPDEVVRYIHPDECQLSYNPLKMALLWEALATKEVKLLEHSMRHRSRIPSGCAWVNYLRCHDDIGWLFDDDDARKVGIDPVGHRKYLNRFYTGEYPGSFARGVPFQFNPDTGDVRISGTLSSLAGLEDAVEKGDDGRIEMAVRRINMLWAIQVSIGGIPLLYAGDEFGQMNDYTYMTDPAKISDSRWVHRAKRRWEARDDLSDQDTLEWRFFREMVKLFRLRKQIPAFRNGGMEVISTGNPHLFGYIRAFDTQKIFIINNFSDKLQKVDADVLELYGAKGEVVNLMSDEVISIDGGLLIEAYRVVWLDVS